MLRYLQAQQQYENAPQALSILYENEVYFPIFLHVAIDQDRPVGDAKTFREHTHDLYHMVLYTKSTGFYLKCGKKFRAEPGTLVIVSPGQPHDFVSLRNSSTYSEITFSFSTKSGKLLTLPFEELLNLYTGVKGQFHSEPHILREVTKELAISMIQIMDYLQSPSPMSCFYAFRALAHVFDIVVAHCYSEMTNTTPFSPDQCIQTVKQYIDEHYTETITAEDLAEMSHCSRGHLFRAFKKAFRVPPLAYQQNLRFEAAQRLLRFTPLRCYEIAQRVGYSNVYYFHRQFKKRMGMTPEHYRRSMK